MTSTLPPEKLATIHEGIVAREEHGITILAPADQRPFRRVLYVNSYGGGEFWYGTVRGGCPGHHLWGCIELARMGYEVALAEPVSHFHYRRPLPHDLDLVRWARHWLKADDILYCGHTLLFWAPLLKQLRLLRCRLVSLIYAREHLDFARTHDGIIALTPSAAEQARRLAPRTKIVHLGWGNDLTLVPRLPYDPQTFLSCGKTHRDHHTLRQAAARSSFPIRLISPEPVGGDWPKNVTVVNTGRAQEVISYENLLNDHYATAAASLIILKNDPQELTAVGMTNLMEAMAMARPVIVTRTGALQGELDVEAAGCGLHVPPDDPAALADAMNAIASDPVRARDMGQSGRRLSERHYNIARYAEGLDQFLKTL